MDRTILVSGSGHGAKKLAIDPVRLRARSDPCFSLSVEPACRQAFVVVCVIFAMVVMSIAVEPLSRAFCVMCVSLFWDADNRDLRAVMYDQPLLVRQLEYTKKPFE